MSRSSKTQTVQVCRLGDVLRRHNEIVHPGDRSDGDAIFVGLEHVEPNTGKRIGSATVEFSKMSGRKPTFRKGQIVYGYLRPYLNKVWVAEFDGCSSVDQFAFDVNGNVADTAFIAAFMRSETFLRRAARSTTPGQLPRISIDEVLAVELELPPLAEQRRIAGELTAAMEAVERARRAAQARLAAAQAIPAAYLREVFEGPLARNWDVCELGDSLLRIEAGTSVVAHESPAADDEWGVLKVSALSWGSFRPHENKAVLTDYMPAAHEQVCDGDLLISRCNTAELTGAVVVVHKPPPNLMLSDKTLRLVVRPDCFEKPFLELALRTRAARKFIESRATGSSHSMRNISQEAIRMIPVQRPPLEVQQEVMSSLRKQMSRVPQLVESSREELATIEALPAAYLRQAFEGLN